MATGCGPTCPRLLNRAVWGLAREAEPRDPEKGLAKARHDGRGGGPCQDREQTGHSCHTEGCSAHLSKEVSGPPKSDHWKVLTVSVIYMAERQPRSKA